MSDLNNNDQAFLDKARHELDQSCDRLDGRTLSRLNSIRHAALEQQQRPGRALLAPFGGLATACILVLVVSLYYDGKPGTPAPVQAGSGTETVIEDLDILTSMEGLEFYENLEFYQWLEENESSV
jgi:hypothetical protein